MALTAKQSLFVKYYLVSLNATDAAIKAGYSEKTAKEMGYENLTKPHISEAIKKAMDNRSKKADISAQWVLDRLTELTERCMQAEQVLDREGNPTGDYKFDSSGANKALESIGKHLGMFRDKIEHSGSLGVNIINDIPKRST